MKFAPTRILVLAALILSLPACSLFSKDKSDYREGGEKVKPLEVPPDLTTPGVDDRYTVPDSKSSTSFSAYSRDRATPAAPKATGVLPKPDSASVMRAGDQRWLEVAVAPEKIWPILKEFWLENGFVLKRENPEVGIMETDWAESRAKVQQDAVRGFLSRVLGSVYSTPERDKFRTRIETGKQPGTTEIFISHRGMMEIYPNEARDSTIWQPRPADRELEAEMLNRLLVKLGVGEKKAAESVAGAIPATDGRASYDKSGPLRVGEPFDRAWRRVGLALDRVGFTVEDRDRAKGVFFVRYIDPDADNKKPGEKSFFDKLAFWRKDVPDDKKPQFRVHVAESGGASLVDVQNAKGEPENSATGKRILALLFEQLK
jgi:outer membrane protein assembly factor BamC